MCISYDIHLLRRSESVRVELPWTYMSVVNFAVHGFPYGNAVDKTAVIEIYDIPCFNSTTDY